MRVFSGFSSIDKAILGGAILVLLLLSYLLYDDSLLFPKLTHNEQLIGRISSTDNDVRRKNNDNFVWLPGNKKDDIYNRDSIFTGDHSQASIVLNDGSLIHVQENSLINLNMTNGQMQLDLRFGQFTGNSTPLRVTSCGEDYVIDGKNSKFEINRSANCGLDVKALSGDIQIKSSKGNQSLKQSESLQISKVGAEKNQKEAKIHLVTKNDIYFYHSKEKEPLGLEWSGQGPLSQFILEIAESEDFKKILVTKSTAEQKLILKEAFKEGSFFWRVKGLDNRRKNIATSKTHQFHLSRIPAPQILSPTNNATLKVITLNSSEGLKSPVKVAWASDPRLSVYEWQLAKSDDFKDMLEQKTLSSKEVQTNALYQGTYYTRVRGLDKNQHPSPWSQAHVFNFEVSAEVKPPAPRLVETHMRFQIPKLEGRAPSAETSPQMAWIQVPMAKDYRWELSKNARFVGVQKVETPQTKVAWTQYKPGKYYYRVYARTELGQSSDASETGVLEVFGDQPTLDAIPPSLIKSTDINAKAPPKDIIVKWSPVTDAKSYVVQVDKSADFSAPVQVETNDTHNTLTLPDPGTYFVRVKALNDSAADMSEFSNVQEAKYTFKVTLKTPELIEPFNKATVFLQKDMEPLIWLEWSAVDNALKYQVEVSTTANFSRRILSKELRDTRFLINEKIPYNKIFWRVRAVSEEDELSSEWAQREFTLYQRRNPGF